MAVTLLAPSLRGARLFGGSTTAGREPTWGTFFSRSLHIAATPLLCFRLCRSRCRLALVETLAYQYRGCGSALVYTVASWVLEWGVVYQGLFARRAWESCGYCRKYAVSAPRGRCDAELLGQGRGAGDGQGREAVK